MSNQPETKTTTAKKISLKRCPLGGYTYSHITHAGAERTLCEVTRGRGGDQKTGWTIRWASCAKIEGEVQMWVDDLDRFPTTRARTLAEVREAIAQTLRELEAKKQAELAKTDAEHEQASDLCEECHGERGVATGDETICDACQEDSYEDACPGCGCKPGDGLTAGCDAYDGCGYGHAIEREMREAELAKKTAPKPDANRYHPNGEPNPRNSDESVKKNLEQCRQIEREIGTLGEEAFAAPKPAAKQASLADVFAQLKERQEETKAKAKAEAKPEASELAQEMRASMAQAQSNVQELLSVVDEELEAKPQPKPEPKPETQPETPHELKGYERVLHHWRIAKEALSNGMLNMADEQIREGFKFGASLEDYRNNFTDYQRAMLKSWAVPSVSRRKEIEENVMLKRDPVESSINLIQHHAHRNYELGGLGGGWSRIIECYSKKDLMDLVFRVQAEAYKKPTTKKSVLLKRVAKELGVKVGVIGGHGPNEFDLNRRCVVTGKQTAKPDTKPEAKPAPAPQAVASSVSEEPAPATQPQASEAQPEAKTEAEWEDEVKPMGKPVNYEASVRRFESELEAQQAARLVQQVTCDPRPAPKPVHASGPTVVSGPAHSDEARRLLRLKLKDLKPAIRAIEDVKLLREFIELEEGCERTRKVAIKHATRRVFKLSDLAAVVGRGGKDAKTTKREKTVKAKDVTKVAEEIEGARLADLTRVVGELAQEVKELREQRSSKGAGSMLHAVVKQRDAAKELAKTYKADRDVAVVRFQKAEAKVTELENQGEVERFQIEQLTNRLNAEEEHVTTLKAKITQLLGDHALVLRQRDHEAEVTAGWKAKATQLATQVTELTQRLSPEATDAEIALLVKAYVDSSFGCDPEHRELEQAVESRGMTVGEALQENGYHPDTGERLATETPAEEPVAEEPEEGKTYALTSADGPSVANGDGWKASEVETPDAALTEGSYVTLGAHSWGRGATPEESRREARKAGLRGTSWMTVQLPHNTKDVHVDGMGGVNWTWIDERRPERVSCVIVKLGSGIKKSDATVGQQL